MIESISFKSPRPRDGTGQITPNGSDIPVMRGRTNAGAKALVKRLDAALEYLSDTPCSFWACQGPKRPRHMVTCGKCWGMREIASVKASLMKGQYDEQ